MSNTTNASAPLNTRFPNTLIVKSFNDENVFVCRMPDYDHKWEIKPSHSEVHSITLEFSEELANRYNNHNALLAIKEAAEEFHKSLGDMADAINLNTSSNLEQYLAAYAKLTD